MTETSVVIPTYNRADTIRDALDGIMTQSLPAGEIIVVDDGSTDETRSVLAYYGDRIRAIHIPNGGDLAARNVGLRAAQGRLVAFCDSDDVWMPDFLAAMAAQWETEPNLTACYCDFSVLRDGALSERSKFDDVPTSFWSDLRITGPSAGVFDIAVIERLVSCQPFFPSCMMVSREAFLNAGGWDEGVGRTIGGDFATALRVAALPPIGVVRRPLAAIRKHAGNRSGDTEAMNLGDAMVLEHVLRTRPDFVSLKKTIDESIARRRCDALDGAFSRRDFAAVQKIHRLLPLHLRPAKHRAKHAIASLPSPLNRLAAALTSK